jgi:hypothetical protein
MDEVLGVAFAPEEENESKADIEMQEEEIPAVSSLNNVRAPMNA